MKTTQCDRILRHLKDYGVITSREAFNEYGIMRLAARISDLRRKGYHICKRTKTGTNRYNESVSYAEYFMEDNYELCTSDRPDHR